MQVEGEFGHVSQEQIQQAVLAYVSAGFFNVDVDAVREAVLALPWVYHVTARRVWPDTVALVVTEQVPLARWGKQALVNQHGELFRPPAQSWPDGLPRFEGPQGLADSMLHHYRDMSRLLTPLDLRIGRLAQDERRAWRLVLGNDIEIMLGRADTYQRLIRLVRIYPRVLGEQAAAIARIDLRYTNGFAVRWREAEGAALEQALG